MFLLQILSPHQISKLRFIDRKVFADLAAKKVAQFDMPGHGGPCACFRISPPGVPFALADPLTALFSEMRQELATLHAEI